MRARVKRLVGGEKCIDTRRSAGYDDPFLSELVITVRAVLPWQNISSATAHARASYNRCRFSVHRRQENVDSEHQTKHSRNLLSEHHTLDK